MGHATHRRARDQQGAVALEAALTLPILLLVLLGIIEFTFLMRDHAVVVSDTRMAARIASTGADAGPATCLSGANEPPCAPSGTSPKLAQMAADAIQRGGSAMPMDQIDHLLVYKANPAGFPGTLAAMPDSCSGVANCVMFVWNANAGGFRYQSGTWVSSTISACFPGSDDDPTKPQLDRVGVALQATHNNFTGLFGSTFTLSDHAVLNFEPLDAQHCETGKHL